MHWWASAGALIRGIFARRNTAGASDIGAAQPEAGAPESGGPEPGLLIVRRGMSPAFYFFCRIFAKERSMEMVQDRRIGERRVGTRRAATINRRRFDRRKAENTWAKEDFVVVKEGDKETVESKK